MKNIKNLIIVLAILFSASSCDDALNIVQDGELGDAATFKTVKDLSLFLNGEVYSSLGYTNEIMISASFTDESSIGVSNGGQEIQLHRFNLNQSTGYVSGMWLTHYSIINGANRLIKAATLVTPVVNGTIDETAQYNSILAEARALRAYSYLQLLTYFSTDMSDDSALGVMLFDYVPAIDEKLPRSTNGACFALIESDLAFVDANLIDRTGLTAYKYVSKNMVNAMRARMYLYRKNYPLAKQYAQAAITAANSTNNGLTLATPIPTGTVGGATWNTAFYNQTTTVNPYRRIWSDLSQGETVFAISRPVGGGGNIGSSFFFNTTDVAGGAFLEMGRNLFNELTSVSNDIRRYAFVDPTSKIDPTYLTNPAFIKDDVLIIDKYPGKPTAPLKNDLKVFRISEMYFILAECAVAETQFVTAAGYIKNIRDARTYNTSLPALPIYANAQQAYADILKERRKEFCFEGYRYVDIKRLGVLADRSIDRNITDDSILTLPTTISNTDYRFTLPIPQDEIAGNPTIQQNPGYN